MKLLFFFISSVAAIIPIALPIGECLCLGPSQCFCGPPAKNVTIPPKSSCPCFDNVKQNHAVATCQVCAVEEDLPPSLDLSKYAEVVHVDAFDCMKVDGDTASPAPCNGVHQYVKPVTVRKHTANGPQIYCDCLIKGPNGITIPCPCAIPRPPVTSVSNKPIETPIPFLPACNCASGGPGAIACGCAISSAIARDAAEVDVACLCKPEGSSGESGSLMTRCPCDGKQVMLGRVHVPEQL